MSRVLSHNALPRRRKLPRVRIRHRDFHLSDRRVPICRLQYRIVPNRPGSALRFSISPCEPRHCLRVPRLDILCRCPGCQRSASATCLPAAKYRVHYRYRILAPATSRQVAMTSVSWPGCSRNAPPSVTRSGQCTIKGVEMPPS